MYNHLPSKLANSCYINYNFSGLTYVPGKADTDFLIECEFGVTALYLLSPADYLIQYNVGKNIAFIYT